jgi:hypothetical protein
MMKKLIYLLTIGLFIITGCTGVKTVTKGLDNNSFIEILGNPRDYPDGVDVTIDNTTAFKAEVHKSKVKRPKGNIYAISTGTHIVTIKHSDKVIYSQQIFISAQETKQIVLP